MEYKQRRKTKMLITKRNLLAETAKQLGTDYSIEDVTEVFNALQDVALSHLQQANEREPITVKFGNGLSISSKIKQVDDKPRLWLHAKISRHYNRAINEL
ncbi:hypothetical protein [Lachnoclostridium sp. MSJ-17]|uniref:hypothetical protein n=1 Tax=Lachnoclostridium sp. MSJ-17 TaxID=2841516 RepID=UPI001C11C7E3|nr:hypothetical protein [Lachnoclostridium sp. MSJ-17]MBU5462371.1 hypothetical protein [Lachnoclostridium sp. MSJ-17]